MTHHFSSFIIIGKACLFGTAQLLIAGTIIATLFGIENTWGITATALVIGIYMYVGGYITVIKTDVLQWCLLCLIFIVSLFYYPTPSLHEITADLADIDSKSALGFTLFTAMLILSNADVWQRMMSAKNQIIAKKSLLYSGLIFMLFLFVNIMIIKSWIVDIGTESGFFELFKNELLSPVILGFISIFTLIAVMSTIDTQIQLFSSALSRNVLKFKIDAEQKKFIHVSRLATIALLVLIAGLASLFGDTVEFILKAFSFAYILAPIMIVAMVSGKASSIYKDRLCAIALLVGLCVYSYMFFNGYFSIVINNVMPAGITASICLLGLMIHKAFSKECSLH